MMYVYEAGRTVATTVVSRGVSMVASQVFDASIHDSVGVYGRILDRSKTSKSRPDLTDVSWYFEAISGADPHSDASLDQTICIMNGVFELIATKDYDVISAIFAAEETFGLDATSLLALARSSSAFKDKIEGWQFFVDRVYRVLEERGINSEIVMRGLR